VAVVTAEYVREALNPSVGEKVVDRSFIDLKVWSVGSPAATSPALPAGETAAGATSVEVGVAARQEQRVQVTLSGDANDFGDTEKEELRGWVAEQLGIEVERVEILSVSSGSVIIEIVIDGDGDGGDRLRTTHLALFPEHGGDDDLPMEAVVGLILGIVCVLGGVAVVVFVCRKKKDDSAEELRRNSAEALEGHNTAEGGDVERPSGAFVFGDAGEMGEGSPEGANNEPYGNDSPKHSAVDLPSAIRAQRIQSLSTEGRSRGSGSMSTEPRSRGSVYTEPYGWPVEPTHSDVALNVVEATEGKE